MSLDAFRDHVARALDWQEAHATFDQAVDGIAADQRGARAPGFDHSPWELVEHIRLAQDDLIDFCVNDRYVHNLKWPDDYWPKSPAPPSDKAWEASIAACKRGREDVKRLLRDVEDVTGADLFARDPARDRSQCLPRRAAGRRAPGARYLAGVIRQNFR